MSGSVWSGWHSIPTRPLGRVWDVERPLCAGRHFTEFPCQTGTVFVRVVLRDSKLGNCWVSYDSVLQLFLSKNVVILGSLVWPWPHPLQQQKALSRLFLESQGNGAPSAPPCTFSPLLFPALYQGLLTFLILLRLQALPEENNKWGNQRNLLRRLVGFVLQKDWFSSGTTHLECNQLVGMLFLPLKLGEGVVVCFEKLTGVKLTFR